MLRFLRWLFGRGGSKPADSFLPEEEQSFEEHILGRTALLEKKLLDLSKQVESTRKKVYRDELPSPELEPNPMPDLATVLQNLKPGDPLPTEYEHLAQ